MFFAASEFFLYFNRYRVGTILGPVGTGKTLLAVALAHESIKRGWTAGAWTNFPSSLPEFKPDSADEARQYGGTFFVLDEGWDFADARDSQKGFSKYGGYIRKLKSRFLVPSVFPPDKRLRQVVVERFGTTFWGWWMYRWSLYDGANKGVFFLTNPRDYFGTFDTAYIPEDDNGIRSFFEGLGKRGAVNGV